MNAANVRSKGGEEWVGDEQVIEILTQTASICITRHCRRRLYCNKELSDHTHSYAVFAGIMCVPVGTTPHQHVLGVSAVLLGSCVSSSAQPHKQLMVILNTVMVGLCVSELAQPHHQQCYGRIAH